MLARGLRPHGVALVLLIWLTSAAAAGTSRGSFDRAPFYDGKVPAGLGPATHAAVSYRGDAAALDPTPERSPALAALLDSLNAELDRIGLTRRLALDPAADGGPEIRFGCRRGGLGPDGIPRAPSEIDPGEPRRMAFDVEGPSRKWREQAAAALDSAGAVVVVQLRFDEYWVRQRDWKGNKAIELGTGRAVPIPWRTSLDDPVQVLELTGAVLSREGKLLRVGAEGVLARRTGMTASVLGVQEILTEDDLRALSAPTDGGDAAWRTALRQLVAQLLQPGNAPR
jgi:hypothetical protein